MWHYKSTKNNIFFTFIVDLKVFFLIPVASKPSILHQWFIFPNLIPILKQPEFISYPTSLLMFKSRIPVNKVPLDYASLH